MRIPNLAAAASGLLLLALVVTACGGDSGGRPSAAAKGPSAERAFLSAMVPHHQSATEMAKVAESEARTPFVKRLAGEITAAQTREIAQMEQIHQRLFGAPLRPDMGGHMTLGLSAEAAGMDHMDGAGMIRGKRPFDRAFVDEMVPHHEGATRMAQAVLEQGRDPELRKLAEEIVSAQEEEIEEMNEFREREYGAPVPASAGGASGRDAGRAA